MIPLFLFFFISPLNAASQRADAGLDHDRLDSIDLSVKQIQSGNFNYTGSPVFLNGLISSGSITILPGKGYYEGDGSHLKYLEPAYVKDYGAKCDGATDDTGSIQAALNAKKRVRFPTGTCRINSTLSLNSGQEIFGDGPLNTIIDYYGSGAAVVNVDTMTRAYSWNVHDIQLLNAGGSGANTTGSGTKGFYLFAVTKAVFNNVWAQHFENGFEINGSSVATALDNRFTNCVAATNDAGFYVHGNQNNENTFQSCIADTNTNWGFRIRDSNHNVVNDCDIESGKFGIVLDGGTYGTDQNKGLESANAITNNRFDLVTSTAIVLSQPFVYNTLVTGNIIYLDPATSEVPLEDTAAQTLYMHNTYIKDQTLRGLDNTMEGNLTISTQEAVGGNVALLIDGSGAYDAANEFAGGSTMIKIKGHSKAEARIEVNSFGAGPFNHGGGFDDLNLEAYQPSTSPTGNYGNVNIITSSRTHLVVGGGTQAGNVGIGVLYPHSRVQISSFSLAGGSPGDWVPAMSNDINHEYLHLGGDEKSTGAYHSIGFGYASDTTNNQWSAAQIYFKENGQNAVDAGKLVLAVRSTSTDIAPTGVETLNQDGTVNFVSGIQASSGTFTYGFTAATFTAIGAGNGFTATYGILAGSATITNGLTASSGTFTATGNSQYSLITSSGISVSAGMVVAPSVLASSAVLTQTGNNGFGLTVSSGITVGQGVYANFFVGNGAALTNVPPSGNAGGGLTGTYPNPTVATNANLTGPITSVGNATTVVGPIPAGTLGTGPLAYSMFPSTVANTTLINTFTGSSNTFTTPVLFSAANGAVTVTNGITASSGTFTATGATQYSLQTSSGISVGNGMVVAPFGEFTNSGNTSFSIQTSSGILLKAGCLQTSAGQICGPNLPANAAKVYLTADETINNSTDTLISWTSIEFDNNSMHSNTVNPTRITVQVAGVYDVGVSLQYANSTVGRRLMKILKNGGTTTGNTQETFQQVNSGGGPTAWQNVTTLNLAANDYLEVDTFQSSGGGLALKSGTGENASYFWAAQRQSAGPAGPQGPAGPAGSITGGKSGNVPTFDSSTSIANSTVIYTVGGNFGIGTASPVGVLSVFGTGGDAMPATSGTTQSAGLIARLRQGGGIGSVIDIGGNGGSGAWIQSTESTNLATNYKLLLNPNGGNVGIGTTAPAEKLEVDGNIAQGDQTNGTTGPYSGTTVWATYVGGFATISTGCIVTPNISTGTVLGAAPSSSDYLIFNTTTTNQRSGIAVNLTDGCASNGRPCKFGIHGFFKVPINGGCAKGQFIDTGSVMCQGQAFGTGTPGAGVCMSAGGSSAIQYIWLP